MSSIVPNKKTSGKFHLTPDTYDVNRIKVEERPSYSDTTNGDSYNQKYLYIDADGNEKLDDILVIPPTMSVVYGCSQREPGENEELKPDAKYGLTLGCNIVQTEFVRDPYAEVDDKGKFLNWIDPPRKFKAMEDPTGNAWRGDDKRLSPEHSKILCDYFEMLCSIQSEIRRQLAVNINKDKNNKGKKLTYNPLKDFMRGPAGSELVDIRAKVRQFKDKKTGETKILFRATTDLAGKNLLSFKEWCESSGGARVVPWLAVATTHVSVDGQPAVRCTVDRILIKALGDHPSSSHENLAVDEGLLLDNEELVASVPKKRKVAEEEDEAIPMAVEVRAGGEEDASVFE